MHLICNYFSYTSGEAAFTTRCLNLDLHHMMQFKCRDYILVFFYTWNYSECGATHNGIFKHSLQGGTIFCSSLAADPKQISIWAYFCRTRYMLEMYSILGKTFWHSVYEGKGQILTSCCNLFAIVLFDNVFFSTFHLEWFVFDELGTSAFRLDSNMLLWKSEKRHFILKYLIKCPGLSAQ